MKKTQLVEAIRQIINEELELESQASDEAKRQGLEYFGFGRYGKDGVVTHTSKNGKLTQLPKTAQSKSKNDTTPKKLDMKTVSTPKKGERGSRHGLYFDPSDMRDDYTQFAAYRNHLRGQDKDYPAKEFTKLGKALDKHIRTKFGKALNMDAVDKVRQEHNSMMYFSPDKNGHRVVRVTQHTRGPVVIEYGTHNKNAHEDDIQWDQDKRVVAKNIDDAMKEHTKLNRDN